jgi:phosphatidylserine/phosphatidylglycerophosphate/cardiolipin synthase-like enzyme
MRTYLGTNAGSQIEPFLWNAKKSIWIIVPWIGRAYAERLAPLSHKGIEIRIITSNDVGNTESLEIITASKNSNLRLMVLSKEKVSFPHAKIYIADNEFAVSGSANFTYSGMKSSVENLTIAETNEEVQKIRSDFMNMWMAFDAKCMSDEELTFGAAHSIRDALPLSINFKDANHQSIRDKKLVYYPYYFFEFSFRVPVGSSPEQWFNDSGFIVLDATSRQIVNDGQLIEEIKNNPVSDYFLKTDNKFRLTSRQQTIKDLQEAKELALTYIIEKNTRQYEQYYGNRTYHKTFRPYPSVIRFTRSGFVQVPVWYIEVFDSNISHYENVVFGASATKWTEIIYCPECQKKFWIGQTENCELCGKKVCTACITKSGLIFKKKVCRSCLQVSSSN